MTPAFPKRELWCIAVAAVIGIIVLPCLNAFVPPDNFFHVSNFSVNIYGKYLCYAVLALSVNLLWGYTGLLSLGQALFFASADTLSACTSCS
jgi:urea transport system permease protein